MLSFLENIVGILINILSHIGVWGIATGMALESACIPLPSEVVLPLGGFMVSGGTITLFQANLAAALGSLAGSLLAYTVGYYGGRPFILKFGKYFFVSNEHFYTADKTFNRYGSAAVFFGRLLPVIRTFISLPAGIARMDIGRFLLFSLIGMLPWNFILIFLGYKLGNNYETVVRPIFHKFEYLVLGALALIVVLFIIKQLAGRKKKSA